MLRINEGLGNGKDIGMPSLIGKNKRSVFSFIKDRVWRRVNSWNGKFLSRAGKEMLNKARYFPKGGFLTASVGHNPSYTWRSIWSAQALVKEGCRWEVESRRQTSVWKGPWLRNHGTAMIRTHPIDNAADWKVSDVMMEENQSWNVQLINQLFCV